MTEDHSMTIEGEMTVYRAEELKAELLSALADADGCTLQLDLSQVTELDGAGLQLLLAARHEATNRSGRLLLSTPSPQVAAVFQIARLMGELDGGDITAKATDKVTAQELKS